MSPQTRRKIIKNIEARVLPFAVIGLLVLSSLTAILFLNNGNIVRATSTYDFNYYKTITFNTSQIPDDLTNFPVLLNLSGDSDLYNDLTNTTSADGCDLAFFDASNNQLAHEIEHIENMGGGQLNLYVWVNVTSLDGQDATSIKMYYDDGVGGTDYQNVAGTWDSNYVLVYHLSETGNTVYDSTSNDNDGTAVNGVSMDENLQIDGAVDFDGSDDYINVSHSSSIDFDEDDTLTISFWCTNVDLSSASDNMAWFTKRGANSEGYKVRFGKGALNTFEHQYTDTDGDAKTRTTDADAVSDNTLYHCVASFNGSADAGNIKLYLNAIQVDTTTESNDALGTVKNTGSLQIGSRVSGTDDQCEGLLDEVRISNIQRSYNWILTEYNNQVNNTDGGFYTIGSEEEQINLEYEISGLDVNTRFPFSLEAGTSEWSTGNLTLHIYTNLSGSGYSCDTICLDFADVDADIVQENFSIAVKNSTDGSWSGNTVQIPSSDGNLTINSTQWSNNWCDGTDPFPINDENVTILVRCKVDVPSGKSAGTYTADTFKVRWKIDTS